MPSSLSPAAAIVGAAEAKEIGYPSAPKSSLQLHIEAIKAVSDQTGSFEMHVHHPFAAIHAGIIDVALVSHGQAGWSARAMRRGGGTDDSPANQMSMSYGLSGAPSNYAHAMTRHMHRYGTTADDFAHIAVVTRQWAALSPRAVMHCVVNGTGGSLSTTGTLVLVAA